MGLEPSMLDYELSALSIAPRRRYMISTSFEVPMVSTFNQKKHTQIADTRATLGGNTPAHGYTVCTHYIADEVVYVEHEKISPFH